MKTIQTRLSIVLLLTALTAAAADSPPAATRNGAARKKSSKSHPDPSAHRALPSGGQKSESDRIEERGDWTWGRLAYPADRTPAGDWRGAAIRHIEANIADGVPEGVSTLPRRRQDGSLAVDAVLPPGTTWTEMGPKPLDSAGSSTGYKYGVVAGRLNALAFEPGSASTAYAGFAVGGVWKTTNCCSAATTWTSLWDSATFAAQSVGAIAVDPGNVAVIYAGTGDSQVPGHGDGFNNGIYKSTDGGTSWKQYGANVFSPYLSAGAPASACCALAPDENVKKIVIDPHDSNTVIAGCSFGLFISRDAGVTWTQYDIVNRNAAPYNDDSQMVSGLLIDGNSNPSTLYAAIGYPYSSTRRVGLTGGANGVYKATLPASGAPAFTRMASGWPAGTGNGTANDVGRIELDWNAAHTRIYAAVGNYGTSNVNNVGLTLGIYTTSNAGTSWSLLAGSDDASFSGCSGDANQDWYNYYLAVDPLDDHSLYVGRTNIWKVVVNAGYTGTTSLTNLTSVYGSCGAYGSCHPDQHAFAFRPASNPSTFLCGNDGGVYFGTGASGAFTQLNGGIDTNQFYAGQLGANFAAAATQFAFGGMQDNGNASWDSSKTNLQWTARSTGGDGFFASFDPLAGTNSAGHWITEYTYGALECSHAGAAGSFTACSPAYSAGEREDWATPFLIDQWNCTTALCNNLVLGSTTVWAAPSWAGSPSFAPNWVKSANIDLTKNNGRYSQIVAIDVAHANPGSVIVGTGDGNVQWSNNVFTGANCTAAAANTASFVCTANGSATWVNLTGANAVLPNRAIYGVSFDPTTNLVFYAAVEGFNANTPGVNGHVFRGVCSASPCTAANVTWTDKTGALPDVPFSAIAVNPNNNKQVFAGSWIGFFFTNDITQSPPLWYRFMNGLPNTRIDYLAVDRGAAATPRTSTTLGAFTYGRGLFTIQIDIPAVPAPRRVPNGSGTTAPAKWTKLNPAATRTSCTWDAATCAPTSAQNYNLIYGWGSGLSSYTLAGAACNLGTLGAFTWSDTPAVPGGESFLWWLIVETDGFSQEGSWGLDSSLAERKGTVASSKCSVTSRVNTSCP